MDFLGGSMNFKLIYVYSALVIIIGISLFFLTSDKKTMSNNPEKMKNEMPHDSIHSGLNNLGSAPPNKENVSPNFKKQLEDLKIKAEKNPDNIEALKDYGDFLAAAHQLDEAIKIYEKILKINPQNKETLFSISFIYYNKQEFDQAETFINKILKIDSKDHQALYNLGAINALRGNKNKAKEIWEELIKEQPNSSSADMAKKSLLRL